MTLAFVKRSSLSRPITSTEHDANLTAIETKFGERLSVKSDFGAKGDGTTDDTAALQAAINTGLPLFWPSGTYKTTSGLTRATTGSADVAGPDWQGDGRLRAIIKPVLSSGAALTLSHTSAASFFQKGGGIRGIGFDGSSCTGTAVGIVASSVWFFELREVSVRSFPSHGLAFLGRTDIDASFTNTDAYGCEYWRLTHCDLSSNGGRGVYAAGTLVANDFVVEHTYLTSNLAGGALVLGSGWHFRGCGIATNGSASLGGGGVEVGGATQIANVEFDNCEFDGNFLYQAWLRNILLVKTSNNRFISRSGYFYSDVRQPPVAVLGGDPANGYQAQHVDARNQTVRYSTSGSDPAHPVVCWGLTGQTAAWVLKVTSESSKRGNEAKSSSTIPAIIRATVSGGAVTALTLVDGGWGHTAGSLTFGGGGGSGATGTFTVDGHGKVTGVTRTAGGSGYTTAPWVSGTLPVDQGGVAVDVGHEIEERRVELSTQRHGGIYARLASGTVSIGTGQAVVPYSSAPTDFFTDFNAGTGKYTCPKTGMYMVTATLRFTSLTGSGQWVGLYVRYQPAGFSAATVKAVLAVYDHSYDQDAAIHAALFAYKGDQIWIEGIASVSTSVQTSSGDLYNQFIVLPQP